MRVAEEGAGFILWRMVADEGEILTLAVDPDFRRQGLGRQLVNAVLTQAKEKKLVRFFLEVEEKNHAALALYKSLGFAAINRRVDYYGQGRSAILMEIKLFL